MAFENLHREPGERRTVTFRIDVDDLGFYDEDGGEWVTEPGAFELLIGRLAGDVRCSEHFEVR